MYNVKNKFSVKEKIIELSNIKSWNSYKIIKFKMIMFVKLLKNEVFGFILETSFLSHIFSDNLNRVCKLQYKYSSSLT